MIAGRARYCPPCTRAYDLARGSRTIDAGKRARVLARDGGICWLCGGPGATTVDHVIPRARGGGDDEDNLRAAHLDCNMRRGAR
jgi:5-methylcytosine-specific restriction endonuclease McrA